MNRFIFTTWLLLSAGLLCAQPRLTIEGGTDRYLGTNESGKNFVDTLVLKNTGNSELRISKINKSCGCTTIATDTNVIAPGKIKRVIVTISTPDVPGEMDKSIAIVSNDPVNPAQVVEFKFGVRRSVAFYPVHTIAFAGCRLTQSCDVVLLIINETDSTFTLTKAVADMPGLQVTQQSPIPLRPHDTLFYHINLVPPRAGYQTGTMKLYTTSRSNPEEDFEVYANVENADGTIPPMKH